MSKSINELTASRLRELGALTVKYSKGDGMHASAVSGLHCIQLSAPNLELPHVYNPCVCVIVQGAKQVLLEEEIYRYAPPQFLAVSVDLPLLGQVTVASPEQPYLCLAIDLDARQIADLISQSDDAGRSRGDTARGLFGEISACWKLVFENTSICESTLMPNWSSRLGR